MSWARGRRGLLLWLTLGVMLAGAGWVWQPQLWRAAYPYLPPRLQAAPYRVQTWLAGRRTPVALPTAIRSTEAPAAAQRRGAATATRRLPRGRTPPASTINAPSATATVTTTIAATVVADAVVDLPDRAQLAGAHHVYQTWNNCGPATASLALAYLGHDVDQAEAARALKPDPNDKNVGPDELASFIAGRGAGARVRINGNLDLLRSFLAHGWPVIVEFWFVPEPGDEMGHYQLLVGYDRVEDTFTAMDTFEGPNRVVAARALDDAWRVFNRTYLVVYPAFAAEPVETVLGPDHDDGRMVARAVNQARAEIAEGSDAFDWFNLGSSLMRAGDPLAAAEAFDRAREIGLPWRMLWYQFAPFDAYAEAGRWDDVLALAVANLANAPNLEESHYWRGRALAGRGDAAGARIAWRRALELNPGYAAASVALGEEGVR